MIDKEYRGYTICVSLRGFIAGIFNSDFQQVAEYRNFRDIAHAMYYTKQRIDNCITNGIAL